MITDLHRMGQEHSTDQPQGHNMAAMVAPGLPEEDWDEEPTLPTRSLDQGQIVDRAATTEGDETQESEPLVQTGDGEASTQIEPRADPEVQTGVLKEPTSGDPDMTPGEAAEVPILDEPPVVEATGRVIEMETVGVSEHPQDMTLGIINEGTEATPAPLPVLLLCLEAADEFQDMPELDDAKPEDDPREEPMVDVPRLKP